MFIHAVKDWYTLIEHSPSKLMFLTSLNFYAIAYLAFSYGNWNVHVYNIWLAVAILTECIATIPVHV